MANLCRGRKWRGGGGVFRDLFQWLIMAQHLPNTWCFFFSLILLLVHRPGVASAELSNSVRSATLKHNCHTRLWLMFHTDSHQSFKSASVTHHHHQWRHLKSKPQKYLSFQKLWLYNPNKNGAAFQILSFMVHFIFLSTMAHLTSASKLCVHMFGGIKLLILSHTLQHDLTI